MTLNEFQQLAMTTCMHSCENFGYMFLNLVAEVGEFSGKCAKHIRKEEAEISENQLDLLVRSPKGERLDWRENDHALMMEAGDILWQLAGLCKVMGWDFEEMAKANLDKLAARKAAGTINGEGDGVDGNERRAY